MTKNGLGVYVFLRMRGSNSKQRKIDRRVNLHPLLPTQPLVVFNFFLSQRIISHNKFRGSSTPQLVVPGKTSSFVRHPPIRGMIIIIRTLPSDTVIL